MSKKEMTEALESLLAWCEKKSFTPGGTRKWMNMVFPSYICLVDAERNKATIKGWCGDQYMNISAEYRNDK